MGDSRRENAGFSLKWEILEEKTRVFCFKGGFRRVNVIFGLMGICEEKTRDFPLNGEFVKRKRVIFT